MTKQPPRPTIIVLAVLLLGLSGCLDRSNEASRPIHVGDSVAYDIGDGATMKLLIDGVQPIAFPDGDRCANALLATWEQDDPQNDSESDPRKSLVCAGERFRTASLVRSTNRYADNATEHAVLQDRINTPLAVLICTMLRSESRSTETTMEGPQGPGESFAADFRYEAEGDECLFTAESRNLKSGHNMTFNFTIEFGAASAYPARIQGVFFESYSGTEVTRPYDWVLTDVDRGSGTRWQRGTVFVAGTSATETWVNRPAEGNSPFPYPMERALLRLGLERSFSNYHGSNPDSFLASAGYAALRDEVEGQEEFLWTFVWLHGTAGFQATCHLLRSPIPSAPSGLPLYEEEMCFADKEFKTEVPALRAHFADSLLSWETAAATWRLYVGDEPIATAFWTVLSGYPLLGNVPSAKDLVPAAPIFGFSFYEGSFDTFPYSITWLVDRPASESRAAPLAWSFVAAETGDVPISVSPRAPEWMAADPAAP